MKKTILVLIFLQILLVAGSHQNAKLKLSCDMGNEHACKKLKQINNIQQKKPSSNKSYITGTPSHSSDEYDSIVCDESVVKKYPNINKKHLNPYWGDLKCGSKFDWDMIHVNVVDAFRWQNMDLCTWGVGKLRELGIKSPAEAKKWICAGADDGKDKVGVYNAVKKYVKNGIKTADEFIVFKQSKTQKKSSSNTLFVVKSITKNVSHSADEYDSIVCDESVVKRLPNINKMYTNPHWLHFSDTYTKNQWKHSYHVDSLEALRWANMGILPSEYKKALSLYTNVIEAKKWVCIDVNLIGSYMQYIISNNIPKETVKKWMDNGIHPIKLVGWYKKQVKSLDIAKQWNDAKVSPSEYTEWNKLGINSPNEAKKWTSIGVTRPNYYKMWLDTGVKDTSTVAKWIQILNPSKSTDYIEHRKIIKHVVNHWVRTANIHNPHIAQKWINAGFDYRHVKQWIDAGITNPIKAKEWIDAKIPKMSYWISAGFNSPKEAQEWIDAGLKSGFIYREEGINTIAEALEAKTCEKVMTYETFNSHESGKLSGTIIKLLPFAYLVESFLGELYYVPKFDTKIHDKKRILVWRVKSTGKTFRYNTKGNGIQEAAMVEFIEPKYDECSKYVKIIN